MFFKSDHPVLDSRYLIFEAAQGIKKNPHSCAPFKPLTLPPWIAPAHHYGLNASLALSSVTTSELFFLRTLLRPYDANLFSVGVS